MTIGNFRVFLSPLQNEGLRGVSPERLCLGPVCKCVPASSPGKPRLRGRGHGPSRSEPSRPTTGSAGHGVRLGVGQSGDCLVGAQCSSQTSTL